MRNNTHGALHWATILRAYHEVEAGMTTDAEIRAISQLGAALETASLNAAAPALWPLPDEFYLPGTSYVVQKPFGYDDLAAGSLVPAF